MSTLTEPTVTQLQVAGVYQGMLGRLADTDGFGYWTSVAETSGITAVINAFEGSAEFADYYGAPNPSLESWSSNFVEAL